jgi:hypothetical protein
MGYAKLPTEVSREPSPMFGSDAALLLSKLLPVPCHHPASSKRDHDPWTACRFPFASAATRTSSLWDVGAFNQAEARRHEVPRHRPQLALYRGD